MKNKRIAIIKFGAMGDLVISTYIVDNLIKNDPNVTLYLFTKKNFCRPILG